MSAVTSPCRERLSHARKTALQPRAAARRAAAPGMQRKRAPPPRPASRPMRSFSRPRISPSCAAPRIRRSLPRRPPFSALPASPSPTGTRLPASCAAISRRRRRAAAMPSAAGFPSATGRRTSPSGRATAPPTAGSAGCSPPAISAPRKANAISTSPIFLNGARAWRWRCCRVRTFPSRQGEGKAAPPP